MKQPAANVQPDIRFETRSIKTQRSSSSSSALLSQEHSQHRSHENILTSRFENRPDRVKSTETRLIKNISLIAIMSIDPDRQKAKAAVQEMVDL